MAGRRGATTFEIMNDLMSKKDLASMLGMSESAISKLVQGKSFPVAIRINGRVLRWEKADIEAWLRLAKSGRQPNREKPNAPKRNRRSYLVSGIEFYEVNR